MKTTFRMAILALAVFTSPIIYAQDSSDTGTAAGSVTNVAAGSTTVAIVTGAVAAVVIGVAVAGSSDNHGTSSTTSTTSPAP